MECVAPARSVEQTEAGTRRANCAEARGDSTVAVLGKVVHMPVVVSSTGANGPYSAEHRRGSRGVSAGADLGQSG